MKSKKRGKGDPNRVWMVDWVGGYVTVSKGGLEIKFPYLTEKSWFNIDATSMRVKLIGICERKSGNVVEGKLRFWGHKLGENSENLVVIEPLEGDNPDFSFEISLKDFLSALEFALST